MSIVMSASSFARPLTLGLVPVAFASYSFSNNFPLGFVSSAFDFLSSVESKVFWAHGLGNFPGALTGSPLLLCFLPSLSMTSAPQTSSFRRTGPPPGVLRMPLFVGDSPSSVFSISLLEFSVGAVNGLSDSFLKVASFAGATVGGGCGVPKMACLKARTAKTGAGVSGASI